MFDENWGNAVMFGGAQINGNGVGSQTGETWTWNGTTWSLRSPASAPVYRAGPEMGYDALHHEVVLFGGYGGLGNYPQNDTWTWDGGTWTERAPTHRPSTRYGTSATYDKGLLRFVLFGGNVNTGPTDQTWAWDGSDWTQLQPAASPSARSYAAAVYDESRHEIVLFGGGSGGQQTETWLHLSAPTGPPRPPRPPPTARCC